MHDLIFATMAGTTGAARDALLWARSIRSFGGRFADAPTWLLVPQHVERLPASLRVELERAGVRLLPFEIGDAMLDFPFAGKTVAAGTAEEQAQGSLLVWMDRDSLVIRESLDLLLAAGTVLGYRPVDHTLIGSRMSEAPDPFWSLIYAHCGVDTEQLAPMITSVDNAVIRPYFNAGMLVVRPQRNLLRTWSQTFRRLYMLPAFAPFYEQDFFYRLFIHQAVLAGILLAGTGNNERRELPHLVNYPLHMHEGYPPSQRPARLNDVISFRYDTLVDDPDWDQVIAIDEPLRSWLQQERGRLDLD